MRNVSKEIFLDSLVCPALGWMIRNDKISKTDTLGDKFRMWQGLEVHSRVRGLYPQGIFIDEQNIDTAADITTNLIEDPEASVLFEATFIADGYVAKTDILQRLDDGWHIIEVKSSVRDKPEFIDDMAYTTMIVEQFGLQIKKITLFLVSKEYRLGMDDNLLFVEVDHAFEVKSRVEEFREFLGIIEEVTRSPEKPETVLRFECRKCKHFRECLGKDMEHHIFDLPRLSQPKFNGLMGLDIISIEDIPVDFELTSFQERVRECVQSGIIFVSGYLYDSLESIVWPVFYLDFETMMTAIPLYPGIAPYTQIPTQYSIHVCSDVGEIIDHFEYLADPRRDCRREFAENLIQNLQVDGSIVVYSNFEKTIINALMAQFLDLTDGLSNIVSRLVDLEAIIKKNFYHPGFYGSTSIKNTLPALVPEMSYEDLAIMDGDTAMSVFAFMAIGKYTDTEAEIKKRDLLEYCKQDTLAMIYLHQRLHENIL